MCVDYLSSINAVLDIGKRDLELIVEFVREYRANAGITPTPGIKPELSCIAFGEGYNLLYRQLVTTFEGEGGWNELDCPEIRELVLRQIQKDKK
jgi:hypothetical protein